jgi:hypothetical protein
MITFGKFMEIAVNPDAADFVKKQVGSLRSSSKVKPDESGFNIIPIRLPYSTYNVFKRYINPKYELAGNLLDRRGDSVDFVTVKASNEELVNLKELADQIQAGRSEGEVRTAQATIKAIEDSMSANT